MSKCVPNACSARLRSRWMVSAPTCRRQARPSLAAAALKLLESEAAIAVGSTPAEFARFIDVEQQRWKPVIVRAKIKPD